MTLKTVPGGWINTDINMDDIAIKHTIGRWYAKEPTKYFNILPQGVKAYKMYVTKVDPKNDIIVYDSFYMDGNNAVINSKVDKEASWDSFIKCIEMGELQRNRP